MNDKELDAWFAKADDILDDWDGSNEAFDSSKVIDEDDDPLTLAPVMPLPPEPVFGEYEFRQVFPYAGLHVL